jgi:hypothetical protein
MNNFLNPLNIILIFALLFFVISVGFFAIDSGIESGTYENLIVGNGQVNYCDGKPFVCSNECYFVNYYEECNMRMVGKVPIKKCYKTYRGDAD